MNLTVLKPYYRKQGERNLYYRNYVDVINKKFKQVTDDKLLAVGINNIRYYEHYILYFYALLENAKHFFERIMLNLITKEIRNAVMKRARLLNDSNIKPVMLS